MKGFGPGPPPIHSIPMFSQCLLFALPSIIFLPVMEGEWLSADRPVPCLIPSSVPYHACGLNVFTDPYLPHSPHPARNPIILERCDRNDDHSCLDTWLAERGS